jgi:S-ribosylhomocysteine lyase LuxS involved in autoinducer biosynthesis
MLDAQIELVRLMDKARTAEGREAIREMIEEITELMDNARKCEIFNALANIRNIGLHTGMYMLLEVTPPYHPRYEKIIKLTQDLLTEVVEILKSSCGCRES